MSPWTVSSPHSRQWTSDSNLVEVVAGLRRAEREPHDPLVGVVLTGLELAGREPDQPTRFDLRLLAVEAHLERRRSLLDVEDLLLVVVSVQAPRKRLAGFEFEVVHRDVLGAEGVRDGFADRVDPERVVLDIYIVDIGFFHTDLTAVAGKNVPAGGFEKFGMRERFSGRLRAG